MASDTPKATLTLSKLGPGFDPKKNVSGGIVNTFKFKKDKLTASLQLSDKTVNPIANAKKLQDIVATVDYKLPKGLTLNGKYELGTKKYQGGATWEGKVCCHATTLKGYYSNKDNLVAGDASVNVTKSGKANLTFNQKKLLTAKYTLTNGSFTYEGSYNIDKKAPAVSVTKKLKADTLKIAYDLKSEAASLEYNKKPFKLTVSTTVSKKLNKVDKPTVAAVIEKTYEF